MSNLRQKILRRRRYRQNIGGGLTITALFRDEFTTDASGPLSSPRTAEPGPGVLTLTQTDGEFSITGGKLAFTAQTTPVYGDLAAFAGAHARAVGQAFQFHINTNTSFWLMGWMDANVVRSCVRIANGTAFSACESGDSYFNTGVAIAVFAASTDYQWTIVQQTTGALYFVKGGAYADWELRWVGTYDTDASTSPAFVSYNPVGTIDYMRTGILSAPFNVDNGLATLNVASPTATTYTSTADQILEITLTAPGSITEEAGIIYRRTDANNYWRLYFTTAGILKLDSVVAGTPTNRVSVADVIVAGATRTIRVVCKGSVHNTMSFASPNWTNRGAEITLSHQNTATTVLPEIGTGWTAANLRSFPLTSAVYTATLDLPWA